LRRRRDANFTDWFIPRFNPAANNSVLAHDILYEHFKGTTALQKRTQRDPAMESLFRTIPCFIVKLVMQRASEEQLVVLNFLTESPGGTKPRAKFSHRYLKHQGYLN